jgi:glycosyltransferase involved in cell wall biosynthesis
MKLIIQIPCYNEEDCLPVTLRDLPRQVDGFDSVEWLVIDDGSTDHTVATARRMGVDHIVCNGRNLGLARTFMAGVDACLRAGADVIVNLDADNQYCADDIPELVRPILEKRANYVIGARPIDDIAHFSWVKKRLQNLGSWVVKAASNTDVPDAPSGFRAMSREVAIRLNVFNDYTYTLETIIQAGQKNLGVCSVPVRVNKDMRPSRLVRSIPSYVWKSLVTILRIFVVYRPFAFFMTIGLSIFATGFALGLRFLVGYLAGHGQGHIQSVVLSGVLMMMGFQTILIAFIADLLGANRALLANLRYYARASSLRADSGGDPVPFEAVK